MFDQRSVSADPNKEFGGTAEQPKAVPTATTEVKLTHTALSVIRDPMTGAMQVVELQFNPTNLAMTKMEVLAQEPDRESANFRFKVLAVEKGIID